MDAKTELKAKIAEVYETHLRDHTATADFEACANPMCHMAYLAERALSSVPPPAQDKCENCSQPKQNHPNRMCDVFCPPAQGDDKSALEYRQGKYFCPECGAELHIRYTGSYGCPECGRRWNL